MPGALEGIRVVDFTWGAAGPIATKLMADHGAEVIRIESMYKPDWLRGVPPNKDGVAGFDRSGYYANFNSSKRLISLDMNQPRGREMFLRLVSIADVVSDNFTVRAMKKWGITYDVLAAVKPDIIQISLPLQGGTGPHALYQGYGNNLQALVGVNHLTGWPDRQPVGTGVAYTDFTGPHFVGIAVMAALDHRRRTGQGQYIDLSQYEAGVHLLETAILDYTVNGHVQTRDGNRHPQAAPHGAYPCRRGEWSGQAVDERWISIACFTDEEWRACARVLGHPEAAREPRFTTLQARKQHEAELDRLLAGWTASWNEYELMAALQAAGVPAGVVQNARDLHQDPQMKHRGHYSFLEHPEIGVSAYDGPSWRLNKTPARLRAAPTWAEANDYVYREVLGLSDEQYAGLIAEGALE